MLAKFIKKQRNKRKMTQEYLASELGVSRPTYLKIESGEREPTISEAKKLAALFDMSLENFLAGKDTEFSISIGKKKVSKNKSVAKKSQVRINVPQEKAKKFEQVLLYILKQIGGQPNVGQTMLYKLLYFIDFDYYEKYEEQIIGAKYIKNRYGPTPVMFAKMIERMEKDGKIETVKSKFYKYDQTKYFVNPNLELDFSELSPQELNHIQEEINRFKSWTAAQISALSHLDTPWKVAKEREPLEYEHVFYRPEETSVRKYEKL